MQHPKFNNNHGITLVELLAALALFSIVIVLAGSLITSIGSSEKSVSSDLSLQQSTNVLMSEIRHDYYSRTGTGDLHFDLDGKNLEIKQITTKNNGEKNLSENKIENLDFDEPLKINLTTSSLTSEKNITVDTILKPTKTEQIVLNKETSASCDIDKLKETKLEKAKSEGEVKDNHYLKVTNKNTFISNKLVVGKNVCIVIEGNATFSGVFESGENLYLEVGKDATFSGRAELGENSHIEVGGDATFSGRLELSEDASICVKGEITSSSPEKYNDCSED